MAASLHQRTSISHMMELLDNLATVKKCFQQIETSVLSSGIHKRLKSIIATGQHSVKNMEKMAAKLTDKRTLLAHKQMILEGGRPISKPNSAARSSERHANQIRKRKCANRSETCKTKFGLIYSQLEYTKCIKTHRIFVNIIRLNDTLINEMSCTVVH